MKKNFLLVLITSIYMESWTEKHNISSLFHFIWNSKNSDEQEKMLQQVMQCWLRYLKGLDKFMMSERKFINVEVVWLIIQQILLKKIREILFYIQMRNEMSSFWKESPKFFLISEYFHESFWTLSLRWHKRCFKLCFKLCIKLILENTQSETPFRSLSWRTHN